MHKHEFDCLSLFHAGTTQPTIMNFAYALSEVSNAKNIGNFSSRKKYLPVVLVPRERYSGHSL